MKKALIGFIAVWTFATGAAHAAVQTIKAEVNGMVCAFCAQGIQKKASALPQTKAVYVNLKQKIVAVELKEGQTLSPDAIRELVKDAGYEVASIQTVGETVQQIKLRMGKE